jgi:UDP-3-O-[3-hydroxymyristoyl] glucosamine N-acyltransferase
MTQLKLKQIAEIIDGELDGDGNVTAEGIATLDEATGRDISIFYDLKLKEELLSTKCCAVIIPKDLPCESEIKKKLKQPTIKIKDPRLALLKILEVFYPERTSLPPQGVHPTVIMDDNVKLGKNISVGPYTVVGKNTVIGDGSVVHAHCYIGFNVTIGMNCLVYPNVTIREAAVVGNNVIIHSGTVIGSDGYGYIAGKNGHKKIPQIGIVKIDDDVEIGANVAIDRATIGKTVIGSGTKIDNLVHIAHNTTIGKNCFILGLVGIAGSAKIGNNVTIAGQAGVTDHGTVGDGAIVVGQAGVIGNIKPGEVVSGFPARPHREFLKIQASMNRLPELMRLLKKNRSK